MTHNKSAQAGSEPDKGARQNKRENHSTTATPIGPVEKLKWLSAAAGEPLPGRVELALLVVVADMMSNASGLAWPSYATLSTRTGSSPRNIKRAVKRLCDCGLLVIVEHGNRVRSNRYTLNSSRFADDQCGDSQATTVVTHASSCSDLQAPKVVAHKPPESIHESEPKAKDEVDRSQADGGATPFRPRGASGAPRSGEAFPEFWQAMGRRTTVADAEQLIREAIADGYDEQTIVEGAARYRRYCEQTGGRMKMSASAWLAGKKWLDDWEHIRPTAPPERGAKSAAKGKPSKNPKREQARATLNLKRAIQLAGEKIETLHQLIDERESMGAPVPDNARLDLKRLEQHRQSLINERAATPG